MGQTHNQVCLYSDPGGDIQSQYSPSHLTTKWLKGSALPLLRGVRIKGVQLRHHVDHSARIFCSHGELDIHTRTMTMKIPYHGHWASGRLLNELSNFKFCGERNWMRNNL